MLCPTFHDCRLLPFFREAKLLDETDAGQVGCCSFFTDDYVVITPAAAQQHRKHHHHDDHEHDYDDYRHQRRHHLNDDDVFDLPCSHYDACYRLQCVVMLQVLIIITMKERDR